MLTGMPRIASLATVAVLAATALAPAEEPRLYTWVQVQAVCVRVPAGFCERAGLAPEGASGSWALTAREARMFAALLRAERDVLTAALDESVPSDPLDLARRTVGTRIRISLDRIEQARPGVGRHLRRSIRTGTFCTYAPPGRVRWTL